MVEILVSLVIAGAFVASAALFAADSRDGNEWVVRPRV